MSDIDYIPLYMSTRTCVVAGKDIYVGFQIKDRDQVYHFNGEHWKSIYLKY